MGLSPGKGLLLCVVCVAFVLVAALGSVRGTAVAGGGCGKRTLGVEGQMVPFLGKHGFVEM